MTFLHDDPVQKCFHKHFVTPAPGFASAPVGASDFVSRCKTAVLDVLARVEALPRDHWVWRPGYFDTHVNIMRFDDYLTFRLRECPQDVICLWAKLTHTLASDPAWGKAIFRTLRSLTGIEADWVVYAAVFHQETWSPPIPLGLRTFLSEVGLLDAAQSRIRAIASRKDPYIDTWGAEGFTREWASEAVTVALEDPAA